MRITEGLPAGVTATEVEDLRRKQTEGEIELGRVAAPPPVTEVAKLKVVASGEARVRRQGDHREVAKTPESNVASSTMPQADIVFVLDVTGSMQGQINGLQDGIGTFASDLYKREGGRPVRVRRVPRSRPSREMSQVTRLQGRDVHRGRRANSATRW